MAEVGKKYSSFCFKDYKIAVFPPAGESPPTGGCNYEEPTWQRKIPRKTEVFVEFFIIPCVWLASYPSDENCLYFSKNFNEGPNLIKTSRSESHKACLFDSLA